MKTSLATVKDFNSFTEGDGGSWGLVVCWPGTVKKLSGIQTVLEALDMSCVFIQQLLRPPRLSRLRHIDPQPFWRLEKMTFSPACGLFLSFFLFFFSFLTFIIFTKSEEGRLQKANSKTLYGWQTLYLKNGSELDMLKWSLPSKKKSDSKYGTYSSQLFT